MAWAKAETEQWEQVGKNECLDLLGHTFIKELNKWASKVVFSEILLICH